MGGLVVAEEGERPLDLALAQPVEAVIGDQVSDVAAPLDDAVVAIEEDRVVVVPLPGEHPPLVESGRVGLGPVAEMPLAEQRRLVAGLL